MKTRKTAQEITDELVALGVDEETVRRVRREAARLRSRPQWTIPPVYHREHDWVDGSYIEAMALGDEALMFEARSDYYDNATEEDIRARAETAAAVAISDINDMLGSWWGATAVSLLRELALAAWTESREREAIEMIRRVVECDDQEGAKQLVLSAEVRGKFWEKPGDPLYSDEWRIVLASGAPGMEIVGRCDREGISRARLVRLDGRGEIECDEAMLLQFARLVGVPEDAPRALTKS